MARQKFNVLNYVRRTEDDRLFGPGEVIDLDTEAVNIAGLIANGFISPLDPPRPDKGESK